MCTLPKKDKGFNYFLTLILPCDKTTVNHRYSCYVCVQGLMTHPSEQAHISDLTYFWQRDYKKIESK